jgi:hypothetical protein
VCVLLPLALGLTPSALGTGGAWSSTGAMGTSRVVPSATLLPSGKVLVAGGQSGNNAVASAELYDPGTGTWSPTGSMSVARSHPTATLLPSGKVLVAGGNNAGGTLASAELYDPATGTWSATGSMGSPREGGTATLLPSGKVLMAGGENVLPGCCYFAYGYASAELYDPASGTWSPTGSMATGRTFQTATLLATGKVLVASGSTQSGPTRTAELYNPATGTWSTTGSLATGRSSHTATLLPGGKVLVAGGNEGGLATAEIYDPGSGTWSAAASMGTARANFTATLLANGDVLAAGGETPSGTTSSTELYDPTANAWSPSGSMAIARSSFTATLLPTGKVLANGGSNAGGTLASAEIYVPPPPPNVVVNTNDSGPGSLRAAMSYANGHAGTTVDFLIPATDPGFNGQWFTIKPLSPLPTVTASGTTIDGTSQTAFTGDTNSSGPEIFLDGRTMTFGGSGSPGGLWLQANSISVEGMTVSGFAGENIVVDGGSGTVVSGDDIGTDPTGASAITAPPDARVVEDDGIQVVGGATGTRIGGTTTAARDVISGNQGSGILVSDNSNGQVIEGDYIGTTSTGEAALANAGCGISIGPYGGMPDAPATPVSTVSGNLISGNNGAIAVGVGGVTISGNLIGTDEGGSVSVANTSDGVTLGDGSTHTVVSGNVISGNVGRGIDVWGSSSTANTISGNFIGTDEGGTAGLPNTGDGVDLEQGASGNTLTGNTIAHNGGSGVGVLSGLHDRISRNSIYGNHGLGIDLGGDGVTSNDAGDGDTGPNNRQNFPVLVSAVNPGAHVTITGTVDTAAPHSIVVELYAAGGDATGYGEGAVFLGTATPTTSGSFTVTLPAVAVGTLISATATDVAGDTSEFARDIVVSGASSVDTVAPTITGTAVVGQTLAGGRGTWTGTAPIAYTYQWERCDALGAACAAAAPHGTGSSYVVQNADFGHTLVFAVTATNAVGHSSAVSNATAVVTSSPPVNTVAPTIIGSVAVGQSLTSTRGTWTGSPSTYAYQWEQCDAAGANCVAEPSGTAPHYTIRNDDVGHRIVLRVTATNQAASVVASSAPTAAVPGAPPANTVAPSVTGTAVVGQVLSGHRGTWTGWTPISYVYLWLRCDSAGANCVSTGSHSSSFTLHTVDLGHTMEFQVTASNPTATVVAKSAATLVVRG